MKLHICIAVIVFFTFGCRSLNKFEIKESILDKLYDEQKKLSPMMADNFAYSRKLASEIANFDSLINSDYDTLWFIERADEVDMSTSSIVWTSERDLVVLFEVHVNNITLSKIRYDSYEDPLKKIVENFDTGVILGVESPLGAKRVFISEISRNKTRTFYFKDIDV